MFKNQEKFIHISGNFALTNHGRMFERLISGDGQEFWRQMTLPNFEKPTFNKPQKGKTKFIEPVSDKEKFEAAQNVGDLINE